MNFPYTPALHDSAAVLPLPPELSGFMLENADELEWLLKAASADEKVTTVRCLIDALARGGADFSEAHQVLTELRDVLLNAPARMCVPEYLTRTDLDAAIRWFLLDIRSIELGGGNTASEADGDDMVDEVRIVAARAAAGLILHSLCHGTIVFQFVKPGLTNQG